MTEQSLSLAAQAICCAALYAGPKLESRIATALKVAANDWRIDTEFIGGVEYIRTSTLDAIANELEGK